MFQPDKISSSSASLQGRSILQIIPELSAGGAERTTIDIAEGLAQIGARALVATEGGRLVGELQTRGGVWLPFPAATKNPIMMLNNISKLFRILRQERVDLVHARSRAPAWVALAASRLAKLPFVTTYHGAYSGQSSAKILYNSVMARGDVVIANSQYTAGLIQKTHEIEASRLRIIPRGTDFSHFSSDRVAPERIELIRKSWGVMPEDRVVLLAARLTPWKGQRVLIEAAAMVREHGYRDVVFILAGDPQGRHEYVNELDRMILQQNLMGVVRRVGHVEDMPAALRAASVVAVPSTEPEAFGRVAVEAQAMGTPVVVSDLGAVTETVLAPPQVAADSRTGWRVTAADGAALAQAIMEALNLRPTVKEGLARRARQHVTTHFSLDGMVADTLDVYTALLEGP